MIARFRRRIRQTRLPLGSAEMTAALYAAAQFADDPAAAAEYTAAADALTRVDRLAKRHADTPTRDALAYALGRAQLGLKDQLTELIEIAKADRMDFQGLQHEIAAIHACADDAAGERAAIRDIVAGLADEIADVLARLPPADDAHEAGG